MDTSGGPGSAGTTNVVISSSASQNEGWIHMILCGLQTELNA